MLYITLRQYQFVLAVADANSITGAAAQLNISQPSISTAITQVEARIGQRIFVRQRGAGIDITPFGYRFIERARRLVALATEIEANPNDDRAFTLACFEDLAPIHLAPTLSGLAGGFPDIRFEGREGRFADLADDLSAGRADLAIAFDVGFDNRFVRLAVRDVLPVAFFATDHPLAAAEVVELKQVLAHPLILFSEGHSDTFMRDLFTRLGLVPTVAARTSSLETMRALAAHGHGVGLSYSSAPGAISYDGMPLVTRPVATAEAAAQIVLVWSKLHQPDAAIVDLCATLVAQSGAAAG